MKRTGLQKNIAFIFDGTESPSDNTNAVQPSVHSATQTLEPTPAPQRYVASGGVTPAMAALRPEPIHRTQASDLQTLTPGQIVNFVKARLTPAKPKTAGAGNKRQKQMTLLVAILAVVLVGVLFFVLGGTPSKAKAASTEQSGGAVSNGRVIQPSDWKKPEPYPADLRDPMKWSSSKGGTDSSGESTLTVRGIVYSETKPSAIVSGQIVNQGDTIAGVKVVKITKDYVEFQEQDKSWKQQVEK